MKYALSENNKKKLERKECVRFKRLLDRSERYILFARISSWVFPREVPQMNKWCA